MLLLWDDGLIGCPEIRVTVPGTVGGWNSLPQATTRLFAAISYRVSDHLPCFAAQRNPDPGFVRLFEHEGPQFIQFQDGGIRIGGIRLDQRVAQSWQLFGFFLSRRLPYDVRPQRSARAHVDCCALHTLGESLRGVPADRHGALDVPCFASYMLGRDISASHWEHDHCGPAHHYRSGDNEP